MRTEGTGAAVLALAAMAVALSLVAPMATPLAAGGPGEDRAAGENLVVTSQHVVAGTETWDTVRVAVGARLEVGPGMALTTHRLTLEGGSVLEVRGGTLVVSSADPAETAALEGMCSQLLVVEGSSVLVEGADGREPLGSTAGSAAVVNVTASHCIVVDSSSMIIRGGLGHSPDMPYTAGDLEGDHSAGGEAFLRLAMTGTGQSIEVTNSTVEVAGGGGGSAPDGAPASGVRGGMGGGFTEGGNVSGRVAAGGGASVDVSGPRVAVAGSTLLVSGGDGGRAGDAGPSDEDAFGGAGGGGYSGGRGASEGNAMAGDGGSVFGDVGRGGSASLDVVASSCDLAGTEVEVRGGDGGAAGRGGDGSPQGGGGGGGHSGGGGGCWPSAAGGTGGAVGGSVGRGGDASSTWQVEGLLDIDGGGLSVVAGQGGDAGDGGQGHQASPSPGLGGAGGGGLSGGGGGGQLARESSYGGTPGGPGGDVSGLVATGGNATLVLTAGDAVVMDALLEARGGSGGAGGRAGLGSVDDEGPVAGGGGGSYSAGGGGGSSCRREPAGPGGAAGLVAGRVGDGGDALLVLDCPAPVVDAGCNVTTTAGEAGRCTWAPASGAVGGGGAGRVTCRGVAREDVPMSRGLLLSPADGRESHSLPTFRWLPLHASSANGRVLRYILQVSRDPMFNSSFVDRNVYGTSAKLEGLGTRTVHWRVRAAYERPAGELGPWSESRSFTYVNHPPVISPMPRIEVDPGRTVVVDLSPYIDDPDDPKLFLRLYCVHFAVSQVFNLSLVVRFTLSEGDVQVPIIVGDGVNNASGSVPFHVRKVPEGPTILGLEGLRMPISVSMDEGTEEWFRVVAEDPDSLVLTYRVVEGWEGATAHANGTLRLRAGQGEVGSFRAVLEVSDEGGRADTLELLVEVLNVEDPPDAPVIVRPAAGTRVDEGDVVDFRVLVSDPDVALGQVLSVKLVSNRTGILTEVMTGDVVTYSTTELPPGHHRIIVVVSDGTYVSSAWVDIVVRGPSGGPTLFVGGGGWWLVLVTVVGGVGLFVAGFAVGRWRATRKAGMGGGAR